MDKLVFMVDQAAVLFAGRQLAEFFVIVEEEVEIPENPCDEGAVGNAAGAWRIEDVFFAANGQRKFCFGILFA